MKKMAPKKLSKANQSSSSKEKRERKVLSLNEKEKILDLLKSGMSPTEVGRKVGKNESTIRSIREKEVEIRGSVKISPKTSKTVARIRDKVLIKTEQALSVLLENMSQNHIPVDGKIMREKALFFYNHYSSDVAESERKEFKASKGWLASYVQRYNLKNLKLTSESASTDAEAAASFPEEFMQCIEEKGYLPEQVFNCDETGLFWKKIPSRIYIHKNAKEAPRFKALEDHLTLVVCGNAAGHMIKPGLVYGANNPRALKCKNKDCLPVFWQHSKKAWMTAILFMEWFNNCFMPEVTKYLEEKGLPFKVLLLIDNAPGHSQFLCFANENVEVMFLPPHTKSLLQPLDQGIIKCIKATYTRLVFEKIFNDFDANRDSRIMDLWKRFTIADAIMLIAETVGSLEPEKIKACWKPLWSEVVNNFKGFPTIDVEISNILTIACQVGWEGFSGMNEADVIELIEEPRKPLTDEELEDLLKSSTEHDDAKVLEDTEPSIWTLEKLSAVFRQAQVLKDMIIEYDPSMERSLHITRGITTCLQPLQDLLNDAKIMNGSL